MQRVIVYYPFFVDTERDAASQLRPQLMVEGFRQAGYEVEVISGYSADRKRRCRNVRRKIRNGIKYEALYCEFSTMPTLLADRHHLPLRPFFDYHFLAFCKQAGIRIGLFYRDAHWNFPGLGLSGIKGWIAHRFYHYDLWQCNRLLDVLFLPSIRMLEYIPFTPKMPVTTLLPGAPEVTTRDFHEITHTNPKRIRILFVGGIMLYDFEIVFRALQRVERVELTLCCRKPEWQEEYPRYKELLTDRIHVVHQNGPSIVNLYQQADYFIIPFKPEGYGWYTIPYKLFEALGYEVPVLAYKGCPTAEMVEDMGVGHTVEYDEDKLVALLEQLDPSTIDRERMRQVAENNTWQVRAEQAVQQILNPIR